MDKVVPADRRTIPVPGENDHMLAGFHEFQTGRKGEGAAVGRMQRVG